MSKFIKLPTATANVYSYVECTDIVKSVLTSTTVLTLTYKGTGTVTVTFSAADSTYAAHYSVLAAISAMNDPNIKPDVVSKTVSVAGDLTVAIT
jgi:hypothetical protein